MRHGITLTSLFSNHLGKISAAHYSTKHCSVTVYWLHTVFQLTSGLHGNTRGILTWECVGTEYFRAFIGCTSQQRTERSNEPKYTK